jgi:uncharacterized membrane protein
VTVPSVPAAPPDDPRALPPSAYARMSAVLRIGLMVSIAILLAGIIAYPLKHPSATSGDVIASNPILRYLGLSGLLSGLAGGHVEAYLTLGLLVLVATPILRVASGFYYFQVGRERAMAAITITVLFLLLVGILVLGPALR